MMRASVAWSLAAALSLAAAALPVRVVEAQGETSASPPGLVEFQGAQQLQALVNNSLKRTQVAVNGIGEKAAGPELDNAIQMQKSAREKSAAAVSLEKSRMEALETAATEQKKKADAADDKAEREKAKATEREAKELHAKVAAMEKVHKAQGELADSMAGLKGDLGKKEAATKTLTALLKKANEIDEMMLAALK